MKRIAIPLFATLLVLATLTASLPASSVEDQTYICEGLSFPDGTPGEAVVTVILSSGSEAARTVMVTVDYYSAGYARYLGRYEDGSSGSGFPNDQYEAAEFAIKHYFDRK
jgi:hypothetical protein